MFIKDRSATVNTPTSRNTERTTATTVILIDERSEESKDPQLFLNRAAFATLVSGSL